MRTEETNVKEYSVRSYSWIGNANERNGGRTTLAAYTIKRRKKEKENKGNTRLPNEAWRVDILQQATEAATILVRYCASRHPSS